MQPGSFWTALVWAIIPMLVLLGLIWWLDRYEKEPLRLLGLALVFGGVLAPVIAYAIEKGLDIHTSFFSANIIPKSQLGIGTPLVEEIVRGVAILVVLLLVRFEIDDLLDGIVYGGVVGAGFGAAANFVSIWSTPSLGENTTPSLYTSLITSFNHVFYGAVIGVAIAAARKKELPVMAGAAAAGIAAAFGFHVLHDYLPWWAASDASNAGQNFGSVVLTQAPSYLGVFALGLIALWAVGREKVIVGRQLQDELDRGTITADEYANVTNSFRRSYSLWSALLQRGERVWRVQRRLYGLIVELAFRRYHQREDTSAESRQFLSETAYRERIAETRTELNEVDPSYAERSARRAGAPSGPSNAFVAGLGGLTLFAALVGAGVLIWLLGLRPSKSNGPIARAAPAAQLASASATSGNAFLATSSVAQLALSRVAHPASSSVAQVASYRIAAPAAASAAKFGIGVFKGKCTGPFTVGAKGYVVPRASPAAYVCLQWAGAAPADTLVAEFVNIDTGQAVLNSIRGHLGAAQAHIILKAIRGPFPALAMEIRLTYKGRLLNCGKSCRVIFT